MGGSDDGAWSRLGLGMAKTHSNTSCIIRPSVWDFVEGERNAQWPTALAIRNLSCRLAWAARDGQVESRSCQCYL